jgi:hypothetical protein
VTSFSTGDLVLLRTGVQSFVSGIDRLVSSLNFLGCIVKLSVQPRRFTKILDGFRRGSEQILDQRSAVERATLRRGSHIVEFFAL